MNTTLPEDARSFGRSARRRLEQLGGADLALRAERDRELRAPVGRALAQLGATDLDVRADDDQLVPSDQDQIETHLWHLGAVAPGP